MAILSIIKENPYRVLGVTANASMRERAANQGKMNAFLKVKKSISFPLDLNPMMSEVKRTSDSVAYADAQLALPNEQVKYAQFWFVNASKFDQIAINHLTSGNLDEAITIWQKKKDVSTLHNLVVCYLIKQDYRDAISTAEQLYGTFSTQFVELILGNDISFDASKLGYNFIDQLSEELAAKKLLPFVSDPNWRKHLASVSIKPIIDELHKAIAIAKSSRGKNDSVARLQAGTKLINDTKQSLKELKALLPSGDLQYQMIADKLGLEILQCGIDYYNSSDDEDCAHKAMVLQKYAQSIVVGQIAKDRCKENVDILTKIIAQLPPKEIYAEDKAIKDELDKYNKLPDKISHAINLLKNVKSNLISIKEKVGVSNSYYLKLSSLIVTAALHNVIEEVNQSQNGIGSYEDYLRSHPDAMLATIQDYTGLSGEANKVYNAWVREHNQQVEVYHGVLRQAWKATMLMDDFDMEPAFKTNRYTPNRNRLKELCDKAGVSISATSGGSGNGVGSGSGCMVGITIFIILCATLCFIF